MSWTRRNSQPGSGASAPAVKRVLAYLAYNTEVRSLGPVGKLVPIRVRVMDAFVLPKLLLLTLLRRRRRHPKMDG